MSLHQKSLYAVLGVQPTATQTELDSAYRSLQAEYQQLVDPTQRRERMEMIDKAYALLSDPVRRGVYDASLAAGQPSTMASESEGKSGGARGIPPEFKFNPDRGGVLTDPRKRWVLRIVVVAIGIGAPLWVMLPRITHVKQAAAVIGMMNERNPALDKLQAELQTAQHTAHEADSKLNQLKYDYQSQKMPLVEYEQRRTELEQELYAAKAHANELGDKIRALNDASDAKIKAVTGRDPREEAY